MSEYSFGSESDLYTNDFQQKAGETAMHETEKTITEIPEISSELQETYEAFNKNVKYYVFCGDDRPLTDASIDSLELDQTADASNAVRVFGGAIGSARAVAVTALAGTNEPAKASVRAYRSNFNSYITNISQSIAASSNLLPGVHSAESNEGNGTHLNTSSSEGLGCAYAANAEVVTILNTEPRVVAFAKQVIEYLGSSPQYIDSLADANLQMQKIFSDDGMGSFNLDRKDVASLALPTAIVAGSHAHVSDARAIINLQLDRVSNPQKALDLQKPAYGPDPVIECAAILQAHPNLELNPRMLLESKILDICATLEALASHEDKHAWDFHIERFGNFEDAVASLEEVKRQVESV